MNTTPMACFVCEKLFIPMNIVSNGICPLCTESDISMTKKDFQAQEYAQEAGVKAKSDKVGTGLVLIPFYSILAIGKIFIEGLRYGRDNWKNGVNDKIYQEERLEHAILHLIKWKEGDRSEAHLAKVAWFCVTQLELERLENEEQSINTPNNQTTT